MLALRKTTLVLEGCLRTMFKGLAMVSAVSGGSWVAGCLVMKGDGMFPAFFDHVQMHNLHPAVMGATNMSQGPRFEILHDLVDPLCFNLGSLTLASSVAASAAVPTAPPPITLRNHAARCPYAGSIDLYGLPGNHQHAQLTRQAISYQDKDQRPYIHLLDGGLSDMLATCGPLASVALRGSLRMPADSKMVD